VPIGRQWATLADEEGRRRLDDPDDYVRFEVQAALERGVRVIPVLAPGGSTLQQHYRWCRIVTARAGSRMSTPYSVLATSVGISLFLSLFGVGSRELSAAGWSDPATVAPPI